MKRAIFSHNNAASGDLELSLSIRNSSQAAAVSEKVASSLFSLALGLLSSISEVTTIKPVIEGIYE